MPYDRITHLVKRLYLHIFYFGSLSFAAALVRCCVCSHVGNQRELTLSFVWTLERLCICRYAGHRLELGILCLDSLIPPTARERRCVLWRAGYGDPNAAWDVMPYDRIIPLVKKL